MKPTEHICVVKIPQTQERSRARHFVLRWIVVAGTAFALLCLAGFLQFSRGIEIEEIPPAHPAAAVIALTGGADRIHDAIELVERGYAGRLLITGVNHALSRADLVHLAPRFRALIDCCVDLGYEATNTAGNALEARRWIETHGLRGALIVVTSNYHMPRALAELQHELPDVELIPFPVVTDRLRRATWWNDSLFNSPGLGHHRACFSFAPSCSTWLSICRLPR